MDSLKKSFKSRSPSLRRSSRGGSRDGDQQEELPMLFDHEEDNVRAPHHDGREVVVNVDGNSHSGAVEITAAGVRPGEPKASIWRESSYEFWPNGANADTSEYSPDFGFQRRPSPDDPPSKLIGQFLHRQATSGGEVALDMDMDMEELRPGGGGSSGRILPTVKENSKDLRVSFQPPAPASRSEQALSEVTRRRKTSRGSNAASSSSSDESESGNDEVRPDNDRGGCRSRPPSGEAVKCSANASFRRGSTLLRSRTRSRMMDPGPQNDDRKSGKLRSGQLKSGRTGNGEEEEEDPFMEEDLPEEFRKGKIGTLTILQWLSLFAIIAALISSLTIHVLEKQTVWGLHLWKWEVLVLVLICGRLVSGWGIRLVVFIFERNFLLRKRVLYFVYGVRKAVQNCLWLGLVLLAWHLMFDDKVKRETRSKVLPYVTKVLICLLVTTLLWLVKTLLVKSLASSFHVSTFFDRIQEALFNQYVIETLSGPPLIEIQNVKEEEDKVMVELENLQMAGARIPPDLRTDAKSGKVGWSGGFGRSPAVGKSIRFSGAIDKKSKEGISIDHLHKLNQKNVSAWNMKRLMNMVRHGALSTLDEQVTGLQKDQDESALQIRSEYQAKIGAKKIFTNVAKPGSKYLTLIDLMRFMREDEAVKTMSLFEGGRDSHRVGRTALKNWVVEVFRERRALSLTLNDTKTAVNKLHHMINAVVGIVLLVIWLLILGIATTHLLVFVSSQLLLVAFIFGNTCKMIFEAIIFLFVMHPFDVGDRCEVDGVQMVVEEMNILTTVFLRYDNQKITYPNTVLSTMPISNYYRSPDMGDSIDFCIHLATPVERVALMKERIKEFIENKKEHWHPNPTVILRDVEDMNRLKISVWLSHRMNHQNMGERWNRRELVVQAMIKIFRELDIEYRMLPLDVNVRNMGPSVSTRLPSTWTN